MNRRQIVFLVLINAFISTAIAVIVVWIAEQRRPSLEDLAVRATPAPQVVLIVTSTPGPAEPQVVQQAQTPQAQPSPTPPPTASGQPQVYVVEPGDSLLAIAARFGLSLDALMQANNLTDPDFVFVGQRLVIPTSTSTQNAGSAASVPIVSGLNLRIEGAGDLATEAVLVLNDSDSAVNLQGWTLSREGGPVYTFGNTPLFPGSGIRLYTGAGEDNSLSLYWGLTTPLWTPGATAVLRNPAGERIAEATVP